MKRTEEHRRLCQPLDPLLGELAHEQLCNFKYGYARKH